MDSVVQENRHGKFETGVVRDTEVQIYNGRYSVTSGGRVWSSRSNKFLKPYYSKWGYAYVDLCVNGVKKRVFIHRLVAEMFIPNPKNFPQVNYKDEDKTNNSVDNLGWCTASYNNSYGSLNSQKTQRFGKPVTCIETGVTYNSAGEAARATGCCRSSILSICNGKFYTTHGYHWKFEEELWN